MSWPKSWRIATLTSLYKNVGSQSLPKIFETVLDKRIRYWSERVGCLSDLQGGFRGGRGTTDQIFILNEIVTSREE